MKRRICLLLVAVMILHLTGCATKAGVPATKVEVPAAKYGGTKEFALSSPLQIEQLQFMGAPVTYIYTCDKCGFKEEIHLHSGSDWLGECNCDPPVYLYVIGP